jgi:transcriptional regulator with XRE-family HTH domain
LAGDRIFGARLRAAREDRGWSRVQLAARLRTSVGDDPPSLESLMHMIKEWENGKHGVSGRYQRAYSAAFQVDGRELFGAGPGVTGGPLPTVDVTGRVAAIGRDGAATVDDLSARVHALRLADDVLAGGDLIGPAFREMDTAVRAYRSSSDDRLLPVIGEFAQIAGWVASDAGQHERAAETYELGISAAREAGDGVLESNLRGSLAYQVANVGDPAEAVGLATAAVGVAGSDAPHRARALAWVRLAWAHAKAQDAQAAMRALGEAADELAETDHQGSDEPAYLYWVDEGELRVMEARAYTELRRPLRAVPLLVDVLSRYDATHARELAMYLSWLAVALVDANEPEEAAATATRMLELGSAVSSVRTDERARVVLAKLEPYRDVPAVRDLLRS